jgi:FkbM family methyltransferase
MLNRIASDLLAWFLRRCPIEGFRWRLLRLGLRLAQTLPPETVRTVTMRDGFRMRVRVGDHLGRHVYVRGEYEEATGQVIKTLLKPGDTFVDIGANVGYFTLLASDAVGPTGRVFAFEPVPTTREALLTNVQLNDAENVTCRSEAAADRDGEATFFVGPTNHRGISSLRPLEQRSEVLQVKLARLDDLLPPGRVGMVKVDVEGAEELALRGMEGRLRNDRPDLVVEVTDSFLRQMGTTAVGLCGYLAELGYRGYIIGAKGLAPVEPETLPEQSNVLFTVRAELPAPLRVTTPDRAGALVEAGCQS